MTGVRVGSVVLSLITALSGCQQAPDQAASATRAVREADSAWAQAFLRKDLAAYLTFVDSTISVLPPNAPIVRGAAGVRDLVQGFFGLPALAGTWHPANVEASRSGDLAYSLGTYEFSFNDPSGRQTTERGKYATVWRKQPNGSWKAVLDVFNSDQPAPAAAPH